VIVRCRPVYETIRRVPVLYVGRHCSIIVECNGMTCRFEGGGAGSQDPEYPDRPKRNKHCQEGAIAKKPKERDYEVMSPWKSCDNEMKCLMNAYNRILQLPYSALGPNSNTYASALLNVCSLKVKCYEVCVPVFTGSGAFTYVKTCIPEDAQGWDAGGYGPTVAGGPPPDWK
jgi:hypothetical protein